MEILNINKENALEAHKKATAKGKVLLEDLFGKQTFCKNIRERIQTMDDVFELNGTTKKEFQDKWRGFADHEIGNAMEVLIVAAYNEGVLPIWDDGNAKYYPRFRMSSSVGGFSYDNYDCWYTVSGVGSRLCFVGTDAHNNMVDAVKKFLPEYKLSRTT